VIAVRTPSARALLGAAALAIILASGAVRAEPQMSAWSGQMEERKAGLVSEGTAKRINQLLELVTNEQYDEALAGFRALQPKVAGNAYEEALVLQNMGYVYLSKGGDNEFRQAIATFEKALQLKALPIATENSMVFNLAQLNMDHPHLSRTDRLRVLRAYVKAAGLEPNLGALAREIHQRTQRRQRENAMRAIRPNAPASPIAASRFPTQTK